MQSPDFDSIKQVSPYGAEFWSARDLVALLASSYTEHPEYPYYVYIHAYPDERIFYVGKGQGNRIFDHEAEARKGVQSHKCNVIREIWLSSGQVIKRKIGFFMTMEAAMNFEGLLIDTIPGLVNKASGQNLVELTVSEKDKEYFGASIKRIANDGTEYYSSREVANFLGYMKWGDFGKIIHRAMKACENSGIHVQDHFLEIGKIAEIGYSSTTSRIIKDVLLSRSAFLLVVQNAHPEKIMVSYGKAYIAKRVADEATKALHRQVDTIGGTMPEDLKPELSIKPLLDQRKRNRHKDSSIQSDEQPSLLDK